MYASSYGAFFTAGAAVPLVGSFTSVPANMNGTALFQSVSLVPPASAEPGDGAGIPMLLQGAFSLLGQTIAVPAAGAARVKEQGLRSVFLTLPPAVALPSSVSELLYLAPTPVAALLNDTLQPLQEAAGTCRVAINNGASEWQPSTPVGAQFFRLLAGVVAPDGSVSTTLVPDAASGAGLAAFSNLGIYGPLGSRVQLDLACARSAGGRAAPSSATVLLQDVAVAWLQAPPRSVLFQPTSSQPLGVSRCTVA